MAHLWPAFSPEENHAVLTSGAGSTPTVAHAEQLNAHAEQLQTVAAASRVNAAGTFGAAWSGSGATSAHADHQRLNTDLVALADWAAEKTPIIMAAAQAYHSAASTMIPAKDAMANRQQEASDVEANPRCFGALTPRIATLNGDYFGHMWPTNAGAGASYGTVLRSSMAALLTPPPKATTATSPEAAAAAATNDDGVTGAAMRQAHRSASDTMSQAAHVQPKLPVPPAPPNQLNELRPSAPTPPHPPPAGMYQRPPPTAVINGPANTSALAPQTASAPAVARPAMSVGSSSGGYPGAGLTQFARPAQPFSMPATPGGLPQMLSAAALQQHPLPQPSPTELQPINPPPQPSPPPTPQSPAPAPSLATAVPTPHAPPAPPAPPSPPPPAPPLPPPSNSAYPMPGAWLAPGGSGPAPIPGLGPPGPIPQTPAMPLAPAPPPPPPTPAPPSDPPEPHAVHPEEGSVHGFSVHNADDVRREMAKLRPGESPRVKEVDTPEELRRYYEEWTENSFPLPAPGFDGEWRMLEDGTLIKYRYDSRSGGPVIEIQYPDQKNPYKVHLPKPPKTPAPAPEPVPVPVPEPAPVPAPAPAPAPVHPDPGGPVIHLPPVEAPKPEQTLTIWAILGLLAAAALSPA